MLILLLQISLSIVNLQIHTDILCVLLKHGDKKVLNFLRSAVLVRRPIPTINDFKDSEGNDIMQQQIDRNHSQVKTDVPRILYDEFARIKADPKLKHLLEEE